MRDRIDCSAPVQVTVNKCDRVIVPIVNIRVSTQLYYLEPVYNIPRSIFISPVAQTRIYRRARVLRHITIKFRTQLYSSGIRPLPCCAYDFYFYHPGKRYGIYQRRNQRLSFPACFPLRIGHNLPCCRIKHRALRTFHIPVSIWYIHDRRSHAPARSRIIFRRFKGSRQVPFRVIHQVRRRQRYRNILRPP